MQTRTHSIVALLCAAITGFLFTAAPVQAGYMVTLTQQGSNVVATGSGAIDLTGLRGFGEGFAPAQIFPRAGSIILAGGTSDQFVDISGPVSFGTGRRSFPTSSSGSVAGIDGFDGLVIVPVGYSSNSALSGTATYNNATFSTLGVTPGTYEWSWGDGANQNFTLTIAAGPHGVGDTGSTMALLLAGLGALVGARFLRLFKSA
ncbi:MAG: hypothetical protein JO354_14565 [Verrucomicrobia bacterium]|nr:hypothetical protein [Verrucomicrobiota bacterium]